MRFAAVIFGLASLLANFAAYAQDARLIANVDRDTVRVNESFTYVLRAEGRLSGRPDLSALETGFDVLDRWSSTSFQVVNGRTAQVAEWGIELMPRQTGNYQLPAVELDGLLSNVVAVEVLPEPPPSEQAEDIFIEVELDRPVSYAQSQVIYVLRLFVGIGTGRATLTAPLVEGGEAIVEKLGNDREYQSVRGDRVYNVRERRYAVFPQAPGELRLGPAVFDAMVIPTRGFTRQLRLRSDVLELEVRPAVSPPPEFPGAVWLPAKNLRIEESWSDRSDGFEQGVPRTRVLSVIADGLLETQLPELELADADGFRQYVDQPELSRDVTQDGIEARRTERFAVIAQQAGSITLPAIELPWWNVDEERWELARVDPLTVEVVPAPGVPVSEETGEAPVAEPIATPVAGFWPWLSGALALGWLATVGAWLYIAGRSKRQRRPGSEAADKRPSERSLLKQLDAACRVSDGSRVQALLLDWARLHFAEDPPTSLGALAERIDGPLATEIEALEAALYGPRAGEWTGQALAGMLRETRSVGRGGAGKASESLVPLYR